MTLDELKTALNGLSDATVRVMTDFDEDGEGEILSIFVMPKKGKKLPKVAHILFDDDAYRGRHAWETVDKS